MSTTRERLEKRLEKRKEWAASREAKADAAWNAAQDATALIPLGQPILLGHHSEGKHRRDLERSDNAMRRMSESLDMAQKHNEKAAGLAAQLQTSIYSDDDDAIEALEARIAANEAKRERNNGINRIVRSKPRNEPTPEKIDKLIAIGLSEAAAKEVFKPDVFGIIGIAPYVNRNLGGRIKADRDRLSLVKRQAEVTQQAQESESGVIAFRNGYGEQVIKFAEKPTREIINDLKSAGYRWAQGCWVGPREAEIPPSVNLTLQGA